MSLALNDNVLGWVAGLNNQMISAGGPLKRPLFFGAPGMALSAIRGFVGLGRTFGGTRQS